MFGNTTQQLSYATHPYLQPSAGLGLVMKIGRVLMSIPNVIGDVLNF